MTFLNRLADVLKAGGLLLVELLYRARMPNKYSGQRVIVISWSQDADNPIPTLIFDGIIRRRTWDDSTGQYLLWAVSAESAIQSIPEANLYFSKLYNCMAWDL